MEKEKLLEVLESRFQKNKERHSSIEWSEVLKKLEKNPSHVKSLNQMEETGGEPDVVIFKDNPEEIFFIDCSPETPSERRSYCYDREALEKRKQHKPTNSVMDVVKEFGIELLDEKTYRKLQEIGKFDQKTSSWLQTPSEIRSLGGAIFGDRRFNHVFIYHNGADSYYGGRGFRGLLRI